MNASQSSPQTTPGSSRIAGYILWTLVIVAGGYAWWRSSHADDTAAADREVATDASEDDPIELRPTIDGQRVSLAPEGAEVVTHIPLPEFELTNQFGETVTLEDLKGRPWVANFIFTRCGYDCPNMMARLNQLRRELGDTDVRFVTFTVDPDTDTPGHLQTYGQNYGATDEDWWLLTGDKEEVYRLILNGFEVFVQENYGPDRLPGFEFAHSMGLVHVDAEGRMIGHYNSKSEEEVLTLRRVLTGRIETPDEFLIKRVVIPSGDAGNDTSDDSHTTQSTSASEAAANDGAGEGTLPPWLARMPLVNAVLNSAATVLLLAGFAAIKAKKKDLHRNLMLTAFAVSIAFLACYLTYHFGRHHYLGSASATFPGTGAIRTVYLAILLTHVVLAMAVPVLAVTTIVLAFRQKWDRHRRWANLAFPIWLYVSVTGVVIYVMNAAHGAYDA